MLKLKRNYLYIGPGMLLIFIALNLADGCSGNRIQKKIQEPGSAGFVYPADSGSTTKFHMKNGDVYVLHSWKPDSAGISGSGQLYDYNRRMIKAANFNIPLNDIVLAETNSIDASVSTSLMIVPTVVTGIAAAICAANPKACFGSCPTFYSNTGTDYQIQAEGFSASVSECLEEEDIDELYHLKAETQNLELLLRNEAYETHFIRRADILALPREAGNRVFAAGNRFFEVNNLVHPVSVQGPEGDCSEELCSYDGEERLSPADSNDLAAKEIIEISFDDLTAGKKGNSECVKTVIIDDLHLLPGSRFYGPLSTELFCAA